MDDKFKIIYKPEITQIPTEQFLPDDYEQELFDAFDKVYNNLAPVIGENLIVFSELEGNLERMLHKLIHDRTDQFGSVITRQMTFFQKVNVAIDLLRMTLTPSLEKASEISLLKKHLINSAEIRNLIAHAKWYTLNHDKYVFSEIEAIDKDQYIPTMKYFKADVSELRKCFTAMSDAQEYLGFITDKYNLD